MERRIYLAGPDVFYPEANTHFAALVAACAALGLQGVPPSDGGLSHGLAGSGDEIAERIYRANLALIRDCDAVLANLMPFRNAIEPDSGTVFEVGFAIALGKPVAGVVPACERSYEHKVIAECGVRRDRDGVAWDGRHGFLIEEFGQPMNLMLARSVALFATAEEALRQLSARLRSEPGDRPRPTLDPLAPGGSR